MHKVSGQGPEYARGPAVFAPVRFAAPWMHHPRELEFQRLIDRLKPIATGGNLSPGYATSTKTLLAVTHPEEPALRDLKAVLERFPEKAGRVELEQASREVLLGLQRLQYGEEMGWRGVPTAMASRWASAFEPPWTGVHIGRSCPICGADRLRGYYRLARADPRAQQTHRGSVWMWCGNCLSYEHGRALIPRWWSGDRLLDTVEPLTHSPEWLERTFRLARRLPKLDYGAQAVAEALGLIDLWNDPTLAEGDRSVRCLIMPSFHPEVCVTIRRLGTVTEVEMISLQTNIWHLMHAVRALDGSSDRATITPPREWHETVHVPKGMADQFWLDLTALNPHEVKDSTTVNVDGMKTQVVYLDEVGGIGGFATTAGESPGSQVVNLVLDLAERVLRDERSEWWLEQIDGYRRYGLHTKRLAGSPQVVRLFASITSDGQQNLRDLFAGIAENEPIIIDLRNCNGMGAIVHPLITEFDRSHRHVAWVPSESAYEHLRAAQVKETRISPTLAEAREQLTLNRP